MEKLRWIVFAVLLLFFSSQQLIGDKVKTEGTWSGSVDRDVTVLPPVIHFENSTISLYFQSDLSYLKVYVLDQNKFVVYETEIVQGLEHTEYNVTEITLKGRYTVVLEHQLGFLYGQIEL